MLIPLKDFKYSHDIKRIIDNLNNNFQLLNWALNNGKLDGINVSEDFVKDIVANSIVADKIIVGDLYAQTIYTYYLEAALAHIARLTVDHLITTDEEGDTEEMHYIDIKGRTAKWVQALRKYEDGVPLPDIQLTDDNGMPLWYTDETRRGMTWEDKGDALRVMVHQYDFLTKAEISFIMVNGTAIPAIVLGAGVGNAEHPDWGKTFIYKETTRLVIRYISSTGKEKAVYLTDTGLEIVNTTSGDVEQKIAFSEDGIIQTGNTGEQGLRNIHISTTEPASPQTGDLWINPEDYSICDPLLINASGSISASSSDVIFATGTITITLFTAVGNAGVAKTIKNIGSGTVTIDGYSAETIDGVATKELAANEYCTIISDGANWRVIG